MITREEAARLSEVAKLSANKETSDFLEKLILGATREGRNSCIAVIRSANKEAAERILKDGKYMFNMTADQRDDTITVKICW